MTEAEQKQKAAIELANAYRDMMGMFAWKHLRGVITPKIVAETNETVDSVSIEALTVAHVAEARGIRKCLERIDSEINWILGGTVATTPKGGNGSN